ncbi:MAG: phosphatidate cytidylyltransferase [Chlamydiales bacterium]|jgi:phosphatidate cytidylyltransferase
MDTGKLKQRAIVSSLSLTLLIITLCLSYHAIFKYLVIAIFASCIALALWEFYQLALHKGFNPSIKLGVASAVFYSFATFAETQNTIFHNYSQFAFALALFAIFIRHFIKREDAIANLSISSFGFLYVAVSLSFLIQILHYFPEPNVTNGRWWFIYLLAVTKVTDTGAYFTGSYLGKRKLAPHLSPGKTIEGAVGGLVSGIIASLILFYLSRMNQALPLHFTLIQAIGLGAVLSISGQAGDLGESLLKRDASVKDSNTLPGLGGMLDTVDSLLFTGPILYLFLEATTP